MTKADTTPKGNTVPPRTANAPADKDGQSAAQSNANGMTNGKGEPVAGIASENDQPAEAGGVGGGGLNTTGMGANSVDGNNVGGRSGDQGVPAGVVDRLNDQKQKEQDGKDVA